MKAEHWTPRCASSHVGGYLCLEVIHRFPRTDIATTHDAHGTPTIARNIPPRCLEFVVGYCDTVFLRGMLNLSSKYVSESVVISRSENSISPRQKGKKKCKNLLLVVRRVAQNFAMPRTEGRVPRELQLAVERSAPQ